jgi:hypothetical protein
VPPGEGIGAGVRSQVGFGVVGETYIDGAGDTSLVESTASLPSLATPYVDRQHMICIVFSAFPPL